MFWKKISFLFILALLACGAVMTSCKDSDPHLSKSISKHNLQLAVPENQAYAGAYIDFGEFEDNVTLEGIEDFDKLVNRKQAIIAFSNVWGKKAFPSKQMRIIGYYGAVPLVFWTPWKEPYKDRKPLGYSLTEIIAGQFDAYITDWAIAAREYQAPMFLSFGLEMNGEWFPWSGLFYGAGTPVPGTNPVRYQGPETFINAYRHVVDLFRKAGAKNVLWVFHPNNTSAPSEPWNTMANYWPGSDYVDWIAMSAYGKQFPGEGWIKFDEAVVPYYKEICALDPDKPFMLAEWGIGEFPKNGDKGAWITEALQKFSSQFPRFKASVFWHERWQNGDLSYSNLRVNSSTGALSAYKEGIAQPFWLDRPIYTERRN